VVASDREGRGMRDAGRAQFRSSLGQLQQELPTIMFVDQAGQDGRSPHHQFIGLRAPVGLFILRLPQPYPDVSKWVVVQQHAREGAH